MQNQRRLRACADSEGPDQPAHPRRLIRALLSANNIIGYFRMYDCRANARKIFCRVHMFEGTFSLYMDNIMLHKNNEAVLEVTHFKFAVYLRLRQKVQTNRKQPTDKLPPTKVRRSHR